MMRVVKGFLFLGFFFLVGCATTMLPNSISGPYYEKYPPVGIGVLYDFDKNKFKKTASGHLNAKTKWRGTYRISKDTLILNYKSLKDPDPSTFKFIRKKESIDPNSNSKAPVNSSVEFFIVEKNDEPLKGAALAVLGNSEKVLEGFSSDSSGSYPEISLSEKMQKFMFNYIGRKSVIIPVDTLRGYHSKVKVTLSDSATTYSDYNETKKYLIKDFEKNRIVLEALVEDSKRIVLVRKGTE
ncbi:MAG: hypothetical protein JXR26_12070 [Balneolaceae bacterium]|nr:hypothetical protein [Balneolaceae bacterium]